jgi:cell division septation protein DedD
MPDQPFAGDRSTARLYRAVMGEAQAKHYLPTFERFDDRGVAGPSWNGAAALFHLGWLIHHRLWKALVGWLALVAVLALIVTGLWRYAFDWPVGVKLGGSLSVALFACLVPGLWGSAWLHDGLRQRMIDTVRSEPSLDAACEALSAAARRRQRQNTWALAGFLGSGTLVALLWLMVPWGRLTGPEAPSRPKPVEIAAAPPSRSKASTPGLDETVHTEPSRAVATDAVAAPVPQDEKKVEAAALAAQASTSAAPSSSDALNGALNAKRVDSRGADTGQGGSLGVEQVAGGLEKSAKAVALPASSPPPSAMRSSAVPGPRPPDSDKPAVEQRPNAATKSAIQPEPTGDAKVRPFANRFGIAVGMFAVKANAERVAARLTGADLPVVSDSVASSRGDLTRIRVGPFQQREQAQAAAAKVRALGLDAKVFAP